MLNATLWINLSDLVMSRKNQIRSIYDQFICESRTDKTDQRWKGVSIWYTVERWEHQLRNNMRETSVKGILRCSRVPLCVLSQSCLTLCNLMDCNPQDSSVHRIFQARILEWIAISFSRDLPDLGIEPTPLVSPALAGGFFTTVPPGEVCEYL